MSDILKRAGEIVYSRSEEKERQYGPISESFTRTAKIASQMTGKELTAQDIVKIQMSLKMSRQANKHKEDNLLDLVCYAAILNELENEIT